MDAQGLLIAIEGTDSTQETAQFMLLRDQLVADGYQVASFSFPRLDQPSGSFVKDYLDGAYGSPEVVGSYTGAIFYALDRYQSAGAIKQALAEGKVVLVQGYSGANMAQQGSLFKHPEERRGFFIWLDNLEFQMLGIPRPDKSIILRTTSSADIPGLVQVYDDLCQLFPKDFTRIDCERDNLQLSSQTIGKLVRETVEPLLPARQVAPQPQPVDPVSLQFKYYTPPELNTATARLYTQQMDKLTAIYAEMLQKLTSHMGSQAEARQVLRRVLPTSAIIGSQSSPIGSSYINKAPEGVLADIAQKHLVNQLAPLSKGVDLVGVQPRNELELAANILYQQSNLSLRDIRNEVSNWTYEQKAQTLTAFVAEHHSHPSVLEKVTYSWDLLTSFETLIDFASLNTGQGLSWQVLTPRYGYNVPTSIEDAGLSDLFEQGFDTSLSLYSQMQTAGYPSQAQYATLLGHRARWEVSLNGQETIQLQRTRIENPGLAKLVRVMQEKIAEVHPILWERD